MIAAKATDRKTDVLLVGGIDAVVRLQALPTGEKIRFTVHKSISEPRLAAVDAIVFAIDEAFPGAIGEVALSVERYPDKPVIVVLDPGVLDMARDAIGHGASDTVVSSLLNGRRLAQIIQLNIARSRQVTGASVREYAASRYRRSWAQLLDNIAARFDQTTGPNVDAQIDETLATVGAFANADRSYLFQYDAHADTMSNTHEWCAAGIEPQMDGLAEVPCDFFPSWMDRFHAGQLVRIPSVADVSGDAGRELEMLQAQGIRSVVAVPIRRGTTLVGFVGFDAVHAARAWDVNEALLLERTAELIGALLAAR